jgi:hypothetical protein
MMTYFLDNIVNYPNFIISANATDNESTEITKNL